MRRLGCALLALTVVAVGWLHGSAAAQAPAAQSGTATANDTARFLAGLKPSEGSPLVALTSDPAWQAHAKSFDAQWLLLEQRQLSKVRAQLVREFGGAPLERTKRIALIGLRGAGKSSLGSRLAKQLGVPFIELDREIEREAGTSLSEIFLLYGQPGYRRYERRCLEKVVRQHERCVMATGGSIVSEPGTYDLLLSACYTIWLKALPEEHMARVVAQGDTRPMAGNAEAMDDLRRILEGRAALYGQADAVVDTAGRTLEQSLKDLRRAIRA